jgi:mRNA-degrading endonuclease toxin of MazEF toxin-antitoxin module
MYYILCEKTEGSEQKGKRPAVVVSNDTGNAYAPIIEVVFLTTNTKRWLPTHVEIKSSSARSKALCEQVTTVDKKRVSDYVGKVTKREMEEIEKAIKISLAIEEREEEKMEELIKIGKQKIQVKEYKGQRVVTFKDVELVHERPEGTANKRFLDNKKRFLEGEDYFVVSNSEIRKSRLFPISDNDYMDKVLLTEQGYLMLVKSFTDDLAWEVQRSLVKNYFTKVKQKSAIEIIQEAVLEVNGKIESVNEDLQKFKEDLPILGVEESRITSTVRRKGVNCLGGKESNAYKDSSIRSKVYSDIYGELKRQFGVASYKAIKRSQCELAIGLIENYELPLSLKEQVENCNKQLNLEIA